MPKLSIITVYKDAPVELEKTRASVVQQFQASGDVEHIFKEWSPDGVEVVTEHSGAGVGMRQLHIRGRDSGVFDGMLQGLGHATGEWVLFLNAGDWLAEGLAERIHKVLHDCPDKTDYIFFDGITVHHADGREFPRKAPDKLQLSDFFHHAPVLHPGLLVRRSVMQAYGFDCDLCLAADFDLMVRLVADEKSGKHVTFFGVYMVSGGLSEQFRVKARWQATRSLWRHVSGMGERAKLLAAFGRFLVMHALIVGIVHRVPRLRRGLHKLRALKNEKPQKAADTCSQGR